MRSKVAKSCCEALPENGVSLPAFQKSARFHWCR
jgi:hypothetical protein